MEKKTLCLKLSHGPDKYTINLDAPANGTTVSDLKEEAYNLTNINPECQKIIFKGKELSEPSRSLESYGIVNGSKLMLMGNKNSFEKNPLYEKLQSVEKNVSGIHKQQVSIAEELEGIEQGYLTDNLIQSALQKLQKRIAACNEEYIRQLETLDSLVLGEGPTTLRTKRKAAVNQIQQYLNENDKMKERLSQQTERFSR